MLFIAVIIIVGFLSIPIAKKKAAQKGVEFNMRAHLLKLLGMIVGVIIASAAYEFYFKEPEQPASPKPFHLPANVQNGLRQ